MANPNWVKGMSSPNPDGRPIGAKDKRWATLDYWVEKINEDWGHVTAKDRIHVAVELFKVIAGKRNLPSLSPEDSVQNAQEAMDMIKKLESKIEEKA